MTERNRPIASDETFLSILALAVAALVQISVTEGPFNPWNVMMGSIILFILASHRLRPTLRPIEILALASTWGLAIVSTGGILLQWLFKNAPRTNNGELEPWFIFWWWVGLTVVTALLILWRRTSLRRAAPSWAGEGREPSS